MVIATGTTNNFILLGQVILDLELFVEFFRNKKNNKLISLS